MAKVSFTKLKLKTKDEVKLISLEEQVLEVKQYLSIQDKLALISRVIKYAHEEDTNYSNPVKAKIITDMEIIYTYTNLSFTDRQKEDVVKIYDALYSNGVLNSILETIPSSELKLIYEGVEKSVKSVYEYQNSVFGVLEAIKADYSDTNFNIKELEALVKDKDSYALLSELSQFFGHNKPM